MFVLLLLFDFDETLENTSNTPNSTSGVNKNEEINSVFERLRESRRLHPRNFLAAHLNINSYRYKFDEIKELLSDKIVDISSLSRNRSWTLLLMTTYS
jgi:hypothetical protein